MATYKHLGYFNGLDAVYNSNLTPDAVVEAMKNGIGQFFTCGFDAERREEEELMKRDDHKYTKDKKYIVCYDVTEYFSKMSEEEKSGLEDEEVIGSYIDILERED